MGNSKSKNKAVQVQKIPSQIPPMPDHTISLKQIEKKYKTNLQKGLTNEQAARRSADNDADIHPVYPEDLRYPEKTMVIRSGKSVMINSNGLVLGDIVLINQKMVFPADLRIIQCNELQVSTQKLTGEWQPVIRTVECTNRDEPVWSKNLAFLGTLCVSGTGKGLVIALGKNTEIGKLLVIIAKNNSS